MPEEFNPFGLTGSASLAERRRAMLEKQSNVRRSQLTGMNLAGAETGAAIGNLLGRAIGAAGLAKDTEQEAAIAVDRATKNASAGFNSLSDADRATDPFGQAIQKRKILIAELEEEGLQGDADKVRTQMFELHDQQEKFLASQGKRQKQDLEIDQAKEDLKAQKEGRRESDSIIRLQNTLNLLDPSDPKQAARMDQINALIEKMTTITGTTEFDPGQADKVTIRKVEQSIIDGQGSLDGFQLAQQTFKPEFLQLGTQLKNFAVKYGEIAGLPIPDEAKSGLREFTAFKQRTSSNLNAYIKQITGAQMSNPEAVRLKKDVPTVDDSPTEYQEKLNNITVKLAAVNARAMSAMLHVDDRPKFLAELTKPLSKFEATAEGNLQQQENNQLEQDAMEALKMLEGLQQGQ